MRFSDIIGQEQVKHLLVQAVRDGRVPHAQLFSGPTGVGKLSLALAYAQYLEKIHAAFVLHACNIKNYSILTYILCFPL